MIVCKRQKKILTWSVLTAAAALILAACQQSQHPDVTQADRHWQVIESLGDARIETGRSPYAINLRSGDEIAENSRIVTGRSSHLILSQGDVQLTASGDSSLSLPADMSLSALSHNYGSVRIRLAAAANAMKLIATPHLTASGTNAVLALLVDDQESLITIESGSIVLSTSNGEHHAQLAAGASARLGANTNGELEIRPAAGMPFRPSGALRAVQSTREPVKPDHQIDSEALLRDQAESDHRSAGPDRVAIVPASRPKVKPPRSQSVLPDLAMTSGDKSLVGPNAPAQRKEFVEPIAVDDHQADDPAKLQQQFDHLTEGLLDHLPTAKTQMRQDL